MSITITIGERIAPVDEDGNWRPAIQSEGMIPGAPLFPNDWTGSSNKRQMSMLEWSAFLGATGLTALFEGDDGLLTVNNSPHLLEARHELTLQAAVAAWQARYPQARPQYDGKDSTGAVVELATWEDIMLARLLWFAWWVAWARRSCLDPAIEGDW